MKKPALLLITLLSVSLVAQAAAPSPKALSMLEAALSCTQLPANFQPAQDVLASAGWNGSQGEKPVALPAPLKVFGLTTQKIAVSRDGGEQYYRAYFAGVSQQELVKAARLKLGKDGKQYGRVTKLGVLTADTQDGASTLTCTIDTEG